MPCRKSRQNQSDDAGYGAQQDVIDRHESLIELSLVHDLSP